MTRTESAIIVAAIATMLLLTSSALAAEPAKSAPNTADECAQTSDMTRFAWCQVAASHVAELGGDLRLAIAKIDLAAQYLDQDAVVLTRSLELRARLGAQYSGFAREALYRCPAVRNMKQGALRTRAVAACKAAFQTVQPAVSVR